MWGEDMKFMTHFTNQFPLKFILELTIKTVWNRNIPHIMSKLNRERKKKKNPQTNKQVIPP